MKVRKIYIVLIDENEVLRTTDMSKAYEKLEKLREEINEYRTLYAGLRDNLTFYKQAWLREVKA